MASLPTWIRSGRAEEADQLVLQLRDNVDALLLCGAAGLGKSTLALAVGWLLQEAGEQPNAWLNGSINGVDAEMMCHPMSSI